MGDIYELHDASDVKELFDWIVGVNIRICRISSNNLSGILSEDCVVRIACGELKDVNEIKDIIFGSE